MTCKTKFVLTLKQAAGLWGCLGNWLPVQWTGKWARSQQGFVGRGRRQAIGTLPHADLPLLLTPVRLVGDEAGCGYFCFYLFLTSVPVKMRQMEK